MRPWPARSSWGPEPWLDCADFFADRDYFARLDQDFLDDTFDLARDFNVDLVGHDLHQRLINFDFIANGHLPFNNGSFQH
jgi:hypothetical protein